MKLKPPEAPERASGDKLEGRPEGGDSGEKVSGPGEGL